MAKKIFTGAHLLAYKNGKAQFGLVGASYLLSEKKEKVSISLRKESLENLIIEDDILSFEISIEQLETLAEVSRSVLEQFDLLVNLAKRDKLKPEAYINE
jgi:hypothetical protein